MLPARIYPKAYGNAMPDVVREFADAVSAQESRNTKAWDFGRIKDPPPPSAAIRRAEEVLDWSNRWLVEQSGMRRCLWGQVICRVTKGANFSRFCRNRGWSRTTVYRRIDQALQLMAASLNAANIPLEPADVVFLERLGQISIPSKA